MNSRVFNMRAGITAAAASIVLLLGFSLSSQALAESGDTVTFDVAIPVFDPGIPEDQSKWRKKGIFPEIRRAEARYLAMELAETLRQTGRWGAVNVVPTEDFVSDVTIYATIEESTGATLELDVVAIDARGKSLSKKKYTLIT